MSLDSRIIQIKEQGLNHRYLTEFERRTSMPCNENRRSRPRAPLHIYDLFTAYMILVSGVSLSFSCLLIEKMRHFVKSRLIGFLP